MKLIRSTLFVTAAAIFAAACGDKITVPPAVNTPAPTPKINSVEVAPATATMSVGDKITLTAAVNADAGLATTVTWASSDATKATVSTAGLVEAKAATPGVAVCATSTVDTGKKGCASIVVTAPPQTIPATVSIISITGAGGLNAPVPVPPAAVAGQIDVSVSVNPGTIKLDSVVVYVNGTNAGKRTFTAAEAAALRSAGDLAVAGQTSIPTMVFSINTAAYNATTGVPTWMNGAAAITAKVFGSSSGTAGSSSTSQSVSLLFGNADAVQIVATPSGNTANSAAGFTYRSGALTGTVLPITYTAGRTIASANIVWGSAACDASVTASARTTALVAPAAGAYAWTFTFSNTAAAAASNVTNYEFNTAAPACAPQLAGGGESFAIAAGVDNTSNAWLPVVLSAPTFRLDNNAPAAPAVFLNPNGRANLWLNDAAVFNTIQAAANLNGMIAAAVADAGVGTVTYAAKAGTTLALALAAADITTPASLAASATNLTYCLVQFSQDKLANRSANPAACATTFGVDRAAPTIAYTAATDPGGVGIAANSRYAAAPGNEFRVIVNDTGVVGNSGMLPTTPVLGTVALRNATATVAASCFVGAYAVATGCSPVALVAATPVYLTGAMAANVTPGYYTFNATASDAAGNTASVVARVTLIDVSPVTVGTTSTPLTVAAGFSATAFLNDDLDIQNYWFSGDYAGAPVLAPARLAQAQTAVNGYNANPFINTNYVASTAFALPFAIQANVAAGLTALSGIETNATNQANTVTTGAPAAPMPTWTAPTAISTVGMTGFTTPAFVTAGVVSISSGLVTAATATAPLTATVQTTVTGATATLNNPFSRVDFYMTNVPVSTEWRLVGSTTLSSLNDNGGVRTFTYQATLTGSTLYTLLSGAGASFATNIVAIGFNSTGTVGMVSAAALATNIIY